VLHPSELPCLKELVAQPFPIIKNQPFYLICVKKNLQIPNIGSKISTLNNSTPSISHEASFCLENSTKTEYIFGNRRLSLLRPFKSGLNCHRSASNFTEAKIGWFISQNNLHVLCLNNILFFIMKII